jgi:hypothetical protein
VYVVVGTGGEKIERVQRKFHRGPPSVGRAEKYQKIAYKYDHGDDMFTA